MKIVNPANWLEWRTKGIGSSDAPSVMGTSPWVSRNYLWEIKTGREKGPAQTYPMRRGLKLETKARDWYQDKTGIEIKKVCVLHDSLEFVRASLDGLNEKQGITVEIKCPGARDHLKAVKGEIPGHYYWQLAHQQMITGNALFYVSFDGEDGVILPFKRDKALEKKLLSEESRFWECVKKDICPPYNVEVTMAKPKDSPIEVANRNSHSPYTPEQIIEILQKAKEVGATSIKLPGFEAAFDLTDNTSPQTDAEVCDNCGEEKVLGPYGNLYCKPCYIARQQQKEQRQGFSFPMRRR